VNILNKIAISKEMNMWWNVTVMQKYKTIFTKQCLTVQEANALVIEKKKEYPAPQYSVTKEWY